MAARRVFNVAHQGDVLIVSPLRNISSLADDAVQSALGEVHAHLERRDAARVLIDFAAVSYFGSSMLEALLQIWNRLRAATPRGQARMAICNLSDVGREIISLARFDSLWSIHDTRDEALAALGGE